jgi:cyanophycin synthetase
VKKDGWAVLNGDDPECIKIGRELECNVAYFSMDEDNPFIKEEAKAGRVTAVYENGFITVKKANGKYA